MPRCQLLLIPLFHCRKHTDSLVSHSRYQANDYYLKELIVEWCEGVLSSRSDNQDFYNLDLQPKRKESFNLFLEKVVTVLQKDTDQNQIVDVRGLSKVNEIQPVQVMICK